MTLREPCSFVTQLLQTEGRKSSDENVYAATDADGDQSTSVEESTCEANNEMTDKADTDMLESQLTSAYSLINHETPMLSNQSHRPNV